MVGLSRSKKRVIKTLHNANEKIFRQTSFYAFKKMKIENKKLKHNQLDIFSNILQSLNGYFFVCQDDTASWATWLWKDDIAKGTRREIWWQSKGLSCSLNSPICFSPQFSVLFHVFLFSHGIFSTYW